MDKETPVAVIEKGLRFDQRETIGTLVTISDLVIEKKVRPPAVIVIGYVVSLFTSEHIVAG